MPPSDELIRFDSKLVRLKVAIGINTIHGIGDMFRFQTGSIKSKCPDYNLIQLQVSIPNWFD